MDQEDQATVLGCPVETKDRAQTISAALAEADTTGYCPECGAEVYDDADACPKCFAWITGRTLHKPPEDLALQKKVRQVIVFITLLTMFPIVLRLLGIL